MWVFSPVLSQLVSPALSAALASPGGLLWLYDKGLITLESLGLGEQFVPNLCFFHKEKLIIHFHMGGGGIVC